MIKAEFSAYTPVFSVTWSSEIILIYSFAAQETFLIIFNVENSAASYFLWKPLCIFSGFFNDQKVKKNSNYLKYKYNIIYVFRDQKRTGYTLYSVFTFLH